MTKEELSYEYLDWMYNIVCDDQYSRQLTYRKLFNHLYRTEFYYILPMDGNRFEDGVSLRYQFGRSLGINDNMIASCLDDRPCSVLEMMIALTLRAETHIMDDPDVGDRVGQWFWGMIVNLGLGQMNDRNFDVDRFDDIMHIFLERQYGRDGKGGLFSTTDKTKDMRSIDIWYQMCGYLNDVIDGKA